MGEEWGGEERGDGCVLDVIRHGVAKEGAGDVQSDIFSDDEEEILVQETGRGFCVAQWWRERRDFGAVSHVAERNPEDEEPGISLEGTRWQRLLGFSRLASRGGSGANGSKIFLWGMEYKNIEPAEGEYGGDGVERVAANRSARGGREAVQCGENWRR